MGEKLVKYYKFVGDQFGLSAKVNLAKETKIPSIKAAMAEDSDENIKIFKDAILKVTGQSAPDM